MSLLWRKKKLRIVLGPDRVVVSDGKTVKLEPASGAPEWQTAVAALPGILSSRKGQEAALVLADQFARYALLAWNATLKTEAQWQALARHRLGVVHGAAAAGWELKLTETAPAGPRLACALERELVEALAQTFVAAGVELISVQPFLVTAFNRIRTTLGNDSCWIVVEEPGRLTLALIQRGVWMAIRSRRIDQRWRSVLPEILERESAFLGLAEPCPSVVVCAQGAFDVTQYDSWRAQALNYRELAMSWS